MPDVMKVISGTDTHRYYLAASQTILPGDPVTLNGSGLVELADAASTALLGTSMQKVTASAANDPIQVFDDPDAVFEIDADTAAQAVQAEVGTTCDLAGTSGAFFANLDAVLTNVLLVVAVNTNFDPLLDGNTITGSTLAGNFTPPWNDTARIRVKIAAHQKAN